MFTQSTNLSGTLIPKNNVEGIMLYPIKFTSVYKSKIWGGSKLNEKATEDWVADIEIEGQRYLRYKVPKFDVALIKGSTCDRSKTLTDTTN